MSTTEDPATSDDPDEPPFTKPVFNVGQSQYVTTIRDGVFSGPVAGRDVHQVIVNPSPETFEQLRGRLRAHRDELIRAGGTRVADRLDEIDEELASGKPDGHIVLGGWRSIEKLLAGAGAAADSVKSIAELVQQLFGA